jgi:membrane-bound lytic murein transglycosylase D
MRLFSSYSWVPALAAVLLFTSCESTEPKRAPATPPANAQAPTLTEPAPTASTPAPKADQPAPPPIDPVEATLNAAEREYQAGRANYDTGHLEAAKENFDRAFDLLLAGPVELKSEDRLQREFDKIVEGVHQLELLALKAGDGFTEQQVEPAPIDEANEVTFPVDASIKAMAEQELATTKSDLPLVLNDAVAAYINYFSSKGRGFLEHGYIRSGRYRDMILRTLQAEGVPQDLIYLAQAESGFHPLALSRAGARGMWQFMAGRGTQYGLARNWWIDERQDPQKATQAAARHLKDLYNEFGDWYLAMAAYNSGPGTVQHAVERTGYADYWELYRRGVLPAETRNYVPIILAITIMSKNPAQYGLDRLVPQTQSPVDTVTIRDPVDLRLVAECVDSSVATLQELNPSLLRLTTPKDQEFTLRLPLGTRAKFEIAISAIPPDMRVWWHYHRVSSGETLAGIAHKYHTTVKAIESVNNLSEEDSLRLESKLIIPITPGRHDSEALSFSKAAARYKVRKGDTVLSVADHFGVPVEQLRKWNHLKGNTLAVGRVLLIHRPVASSAADESADSTRDTRRSSHAGATVQKASTAQSSHSSAAKHNSAEDKRTPVNATARAKHTSHSPSHGGRVVHRVAKGETLGSIAQAYNVSVSDLKRNNGKVTQNLRAGTTLVIKRGE